MEIDEIVMKLIGPVDPVGETNEDEKRMDNLNVLINLVDDLLYNVYKVSKERNRTEHSIKEMGCRAYGYIDSVKRNY